MSVDSIFASVTETFLLGSIGYAAFSVAGPLVTSSNSFITWSYSLVTILVGLTTLFHAVAALSRRRVVVSIDSFHHCIATAHVGGVLVICACMCAMAILLFVPGQLSVELSSREHANATVEELYVDSERDRWMFALQGSAQSFTYSEMENGKRLFTGLEVDIPTVVLAGTLCGYLVVLQVVGLYTGLVSSAVGELTLLIFDSRVLGITNAVLCVVLPYSVFSASTCSTDPFYSSLLPIFFILWVCWDEVFWNFLFSIFGTGNGLVALFAPATQSVTHALPFVYLLIQSTGDRIVPVSLVVVSGCLSTLGFIFSLYGIYFAPESSEAVVTNAEAVVSNDKPSAPPIPNMNPTENEDETPANILNSGMPHNMLEMFRMKNKAL
jgi:hypothetical protein